VPQVTLKSEMSAPSAIRKFVPLMAGQPSATVPFVGITASTRVLGRKFDVATAVETAADVLIVTVVVWV
jgi:hypothetical protein